MLNNWSDELEASDGYGTQSWNVHTVPLLDIVVRLLNN